MKTEEINMKLILILQVLIQFDPCDSTYCENTKQQTLLLTAKLKHIIKFVRTKTKYQKWIEGFMLEQFWKHMENLFYFTENIPSFSGFPFTGKEVLLSLLPKSSP